MSVTAFVVRAAARAPEATTKRTSDYGARLIATVFLLPAAATVFTVAFCIFGTNDPVGWSALPFGLTAGVVLWLIASAFCDVANPKHGMPTSYAELLQRLSRIEALVSSLSAAEELQKTAAYVEAITQLEELGGALQTRGVPWVLGHGYTDAWARFHRAEEALIELAPLSDVLEGADYDKLRLAGSNIPNREALLALLHEAVEILTSPAGWIALARSKLRNVRRSINEYRDERWNGLIVARNRLLETCAVISVTFFAILATAIATGAERPQIIAATFFWATGAAIGLGDRLRKDSQAGSAAIDEGLSAARLITIPLFSGFSAVCGVALVAVLKGETSLGTVFGTGEGQRFLVAAVFGLTPGLLFDTLQQKANKFKKELTSSQASGQA